MPDLAVIEIGWRAFAAIVVVAIAVFACYVVMYPGGGSE
jgi:hypothetical protein